MTYGYLGTLLLVVVFFGFVRVRLRNVPLERDEGEFAYVGQLMLQGIPPCKIACNMKLAGIYGAYATMMAVFGETASGIRIGLMLGNAAATVLVFLLAKYQYGRWRVQSRESLTVFFPAVPACLASTRTRPTL
jgi:hypothetical protein